MASAYPSSFKIWVPRKDFVDDVRADDVDSIYEEVSAMQREIGLYPRGAYPDVATRLSGMEKNKQLPVIHARTAINNVAGNNTAFLPQITTSDEDSLDWFTPGATLQIPIKADGFYQVSLYGVWFGGAAPATPYRLRTIILFNTSEARWGDILCPGNYAPDAGVLTQWSGAATAGSTFQFGLQNSSGIVRQAFLDITVQQVRGYVS